MIPYSWLFEIKLAPGSRPYKVCFYNPPITGSTFLGDYNYSLWHGDALQFGMTDRPFTMNAAMTILQEYLDSKKDD